MLYNHQRMRTDMHERRTSDAAHLSSREKISDDENTLIDIGQMQYRSLPLIPIAFCTDSCKNEASFHSPSTLSSIIRSYAYHKIHSTVDCSCTKQPSPSLPHETAGRRATRNPSSDAVMIDIVQRNTERTHAFIQKTTIQLSIFDQLQRPCLQALCTDIRKKYFHEISHTPG
jgi:hypothetical protein